MLKSTRAILFIHAFILNDTRFITPWQYAGQRKRLIATGSVNSIETIRLSCLGSRFVVSTRYFLIIYRHYSPRRNKSFEPLFSVSVFVCVFISIHRPFYFRFVTQLAD